VRHRCRIRSKLRHEAGNGGHSQGASCTPPPVPDPTGLIGEVAASDGEGLVTMVPHIAHMTYCHTISLQHPMSNSTSELLNRNTDS
jgi:hypothetical protein